MNIIIHRGTHEIGGSCVELRSGGQSLVLDIGLPLVNPDGTEFDSKRIRGRSAKELVAEKILPDIAGLYGDGPCAVAGILLSHAHADHYGLGDYVRPDVPVYASRGTAAIIGAAPVFMPRAVVLKGLVTVDECWKPFPVGPFTVMAHPVGHSAPDALAFEVEAEGKKVFYTGDFRGHGRTRRRFEHIVQHPPRGVDVLMMEGSSIERAPGEYPYHDEDDVEERFVEILKAAPGPVLLYASSQNLDRIVTAYRAALRAKRLLVIDLYTAYILRALKPLSEKIPQYNSPEVRVVFWPTHCQALRKADDAFMTEVARSGHGTNCEKLIPLAAKSFILAKGQYLSLLKKLPEPDTVQAVWSMWSGYLKRQDRTRALWGKYGADDRIVHCSGHATVEDLGRLARAISPKQLVPIHTFHADRYDQFGVPVRRLDDGEVLTL